MNLNKNDIDDLRLVADKLAMRGEFQAHRALNELLDAWEEHDECDENADPDYCAECDAKDALIVDLEDELAEFREEVVELKGTVRR